MLQLRLGVLVRVLVRLGCAKILSILMHCNCISVAFHACISQSFMHACKQVDRAVLLLLVHDFHTHILKVNTPCMPAG